MTKVDDARQLLALLTDIGIINQLTTAAATRALAPELGMSEYSLLNHMMRRGDGDTPTRLARAFQVSKPSMTATIGRLMAKGLVRVVDDADDARSKRVMMTDPGKAAWRVGQERLSGLGEELFAGYDIAALLPHAGTIAALRAHLDQQRNTRDGLA